MITALPASGFPPRVLGTLVPISEMVPALKRVPPDEDGQLKPEGAAVSLAQEWMPPNVCTPTMPGPTPDRPEEMITSPFTVPSRSTMTLLDAVELALAF